MLFPSCRIAAAYAYPELAGVAVRDEQEAANPAGAAMRKGAFQVRALRGFAAALLALAAPLTLAACTPTTYAGISLKPGAADPELQSLASRAQAGDKHAQLELGIRYEEGRGVSYDLERAEQLYRFAAADNLGTRLVYIPAPSPTGRSAIIPINGGVFSPGLPAARARLVEMLNLQAKGQTRFPARKDRE